MLNIASGWVAALSKSGQYRSSMGATKLGEIRVLVDMNQQVIGIDEVPQLLGCELERGGVSSVAVERLQHHLPPIRVSGSILLDQVVSRHRLFQQPRPWITTFVERLWRTVKYEEVYLKTYVNAGRPVGYWEHTSGSTITRGLIKPWATGPRPRCSTGSRKSRKSRKSGKSLMTGGVHPGQGRYYWQEGRDSHLTPLYFCPTNRVHLSDRSARGAGCPTFTAHHSFLKGRGME